MELLEKFDAVTIRSDKQISEDDRKFCMAHQEAYNNARCYLAELLFIWEDMLNNQEEFLKGTGQSISIYISADSSLSVSEQQIQNTIFEMHSVFIRQIISYFQSRYHVSLSVYEIIRELLPKEPEWSFGDEYKQALKEYKKQKATLSLTYEQVLEEIFKQLGGRSFSEYAVFQIKDNCWAAAWRNSTPEFERDKHTVKLLSATNYNFEIYESTKEIMRGLAYFENQTAGLIPHELSPFFRYHGPGDNAYDFEHLTKISKIRLFKNGRVDIRFTEEAYAVQFATEYLGTMPWKEAS